MIPLVDETGQPYAYTDDNPVNAIDPDGLDCGIFSVVCGAYDATAGGVETAADDTGHFFSDPSRWRDEANYWSGVANGVVSTVTLGQVHVSAPYCDALPWAYGVGSGFGFAASAVAGGAGIDALRTALTGGTLSVDALLSSGAELDPADAGGQLTRAGRAYAKAGEVFGTTSGGPAAINEAGQSALQEILSNPETTVEVTQTGRFAGGLTFISPDGVGVVYGPDGTLQYFGRM